MQVASPVLSPTLVQPVSHRIWVRALASQSSIRAVNKALYFVFWIFFARFFPLTRVPPRAPPPRWGA
eukprot:3435928-Pyramimonas_sp.AAC.1